jgi:HSP20 family protein
MSRTVATTRNGRAVPSLVNEFFHPDRFFGSSLFGLEDPLLGSKGWGFVPEANIIETSKAYKIELAAPGLEKKDFQVEIQDGVLYVRAEKEEEKEEEDKNFRRREFSYHSFTRSFALPESLLLDKIEATYEKGILHLNLPKKEATLAKPSKQIKVG